MTEVIANKQVLTNCFGRPQDTSKRILLAPGGGSRVQPAEESGHRPVIGVYVRVAERSGH